MLLKMHPEGLANKVRGECADSVFFQPPIPQVQPTRAPPSSGANELFTDDVLPFMQNSLFLHNHKGRHSCAGNKQEQY